MKGEFVMALSIAQVKLMANIIVDLYKTRSVKLKRVKVNIEQLKRWSNGFDRYQVREDHIDDKHVANVLYQIELVQSLKNIDFPLCAKDPDGILKLANGNHTIAAALKFLKKKGAQDKDGIEVLVVPDEYLPDVHEERLQVFEAVGNILNIVERPQKEMQPKDIKRQIESHIDNNLYNVYDKEYQQNLAEQFNKKLEDIRQYVYEAKKNCKKRELNKDNNFYKYPPATEAIYKSDRSRKFREQNRSVGCTLAIIDGMKKLPESLGKAMGTAMSHNEIHIMFHFANYQDVSLEEDVREYIKNFSEKYDVEFSYEFLPCGEGVPELLMDV